MPGSITVDADRHYYSHGYTRSTLHVVRSFYRQRYGHCHRSYLPLHFLLENFLLAAQVVPSYSKCFYRVFWSTDVSLWDDFNWTRALYNP